MNIREEEREVYAGHEEPIPDFQPEDAERAFWAEQDSTAYIKWNSATRLNLPSLRREGEAEEPHLPPCID